MVSETVKQFGGLDILVNNAGVGGFAPIAETADEQWHRIIAHSAKVRGWTITPSHYLNNQLDTVWLSE